MGPRSKQIKHELISCDSCGCLFTNKDSSVHAGICTETVPFEIELKPVVNPDSSIDYHSCAHAFIVDRVLVGNVEEVKAKGMITVLFCHHQKLILSHSISSTLNLVAGVCDITLLAFVIG